MIVCICNNVKERQIKTAIAMGVDTIDALKAELDVATCCGCCEPMVQDYLDEQQTNQALVAKLAYAV